jgi:hypothetical protein
MLIQFFASKAFPAVFGFGMLISTAATLAQDPPKRGVTIEAPPKTAEDLRKEEAELKAREAARKRGDYTFDDLKFEIERGGKFEKKMLPEKILDFNKKTMRIRGYILPTSVFQQSGIKQFVLVRDNQECCFGPGAMLYDCIIVEMDGDKSIDFSTRPISVRGKFEVDTESFKYPDGTYYAIFKLKATEVK